MQNLPSEDHCSFREGVADVSARGGQRSIVGYTAGSSMGTCSGLFQKSMGFFARPKAPREDILECLQSEKYFKPS